MSELQAIDMHTHFFPNEAREDAEGFALQYGEPHWLDLILPKGKPSLQGCVDVEGMLRDMRDAGVSKSVLLGWYWQQSETCHLQNQWFLDLKRAHPTSFEAFAALQPLSIHETKETLQFAVDNGFKGVGEIHPSVQGFSLKQKCWTDVVEFCIDHDLLINLHVTEPVGRPYSPRGDTDFRDLQWLIETYPEMKLILAHWGGLVFMHELNPYIKRSWGNVYYDVSASPLLYESKIFQSALEVIGADKILYGSDYPLLVYPSKQKKPDFRRFIDEINGVLGDEQIRIKILRSNAERLLG